jgi:hypothetical protein
MSRLTIEGGLNFSTHLHNGDSLSQKTVHVPKGRPDGNPPFEWIDSAADALGFDGLSSQRNWTLASSLDALEGFNGFGYRRSDIDIPSPYLWSFSNHYTKGKFGSDGHFNRDLVSEQCGAAVLLKSTVDAGHIAFPSGIATDAPLGVKVTAPDAVYGNPMIKTGGVLDRWDRARKKGIPVLLAVDGTHNPERVKPGMLFVMSTGGRKRSHGHCRKGYWRAPGNDRREYER